MDISAISCLDEHKKSFVDAGSQEENKKYQRNRKFVSKNDKF